MLVVVILALAIVARVVAAVVVAEVVVDVAVAVDAGDVVRVLAISDQKIFCSAKARI